MLSELRFGGYWQSDRVFSSMEFSQGLSFALITAIIAKKMVVGSKNHLILRILVANV